MGKKGTKDARKAPGGKLSPKQRRFALEYLVDLTAAQAAIRAGYSRRSAETNGPRLLRNAQVRAFLAPHLERMERTLSLTVERIEQELAASCYFDPATMYDSEGRLLPIPSMPEATRRALAGFEEEALFEGAGKDRYQAGVTRKVKWLNKTEAHALALKRLGALTDRVEHSGEVGVRVSIAINGIRREAEPTPRSL